MADNPIKAFFSGLSPQEKKVLYIASGFVFLALFDRLIFSPLLDEAHHIEERIKRESNLIKKNLLILEYRDKIMQEKEAYRPLFTDKELTHEELIAQFLREIEELAKESTISLSNINPVNLEEKKGYVEYSLTIECAGNMKDFLNFIYAVENAKKPIRIISYEISPKNREAYDVVSALTIVKLILTEDGVIAIEPETPEEG